MGQEPSPIWAPGSAVETVDRVNHFLFYAYRIDPECQRGLLAFFRERHEAAGAYRGLFAFAPGERPVMRLFTGERPREGGPAQLGHEMAACLKRMRPAGSGPLIREVNEALAALLSEGPGGRDEIPESRLALWRHLSAAPFAGRETALAEGVALLRAARSGNGRWEGWPFYYTLLALLEMPGGIAREEILHAAPSCRRAIARLRSGQRAKRRRDLLMRVLAQYGEGEMLA